MAVTAVAQLYPELFGKLEGLLKVQGALTISPPSLGANIAALAKVAAALAVAVEGPTVTLQVSAIAGLIAQLQAQLAIIAAFQALLGTAGIAAYGYEGPVSELGSRLTGELAGGLPGGFPTDEAQAVVLIATAPAAVAALASAFI
jgi:hypothetical protein